MTTLPTKESRFIREKAIEKLKYLVKRGNTDASFLHDYEDFIDDLLKEQREEIRKELNEKDPIWLGTAYGYGHTVDTLNNIKSLQDPINPTKK